MTENPQYALVRNVPYSYADHYIREGLTVSDEQARLQHLLYVKALESAGLEVSYVRADEDYPDCVFIEDTAIVYEDHAIMTHMNPRRQGEQAEVEEILSESHKISRIGGEAKLEGGDVLHVGETTYVGLSGRTNKLGADCLKGFFEHFGRRVVQVPVDNCLHLKSGVTSLGNDAVIAISGWFDMHLFDVDTIIYTKSGEHTCANCLRIKDKLFIPDGCPQTQVLLERFASKNNVQIQTLETTEFQKGDGLLTCLSLIC